MNGPVPVLKSIKMFGDELVEVVYNDHVQVTVKGVQDVFELYDDVTAGRKVFKLLIIGKGTEITDAARHYIIEQNIIRKDYIIAEAIVVHSLAQKIASNLYIRFIGQVYPTQFFTEVDKASKWLQQQVAKTGVARASR